MGKVMATIQKDTRMEKLVTYFLIVAMLAFSSANANELCNTTNKSPTLQIWQEHWGDYEWGEPQINKYYVVETNGAFQDMIRICDMAGLGQMLHILGKDEIIGLQRSQGSYLDVVLQEDINTLVVKFLLDNEIILFEVLNPMNYKHLATQKLKEAKAKRDSKAVKNYEKIIKLLQEYTTTFISYLKKPNTL